MKKILFFGILALLVVVVGCTNGTLAGEASRTVPASCPACVNQKVDISRYNGAGITLSDARLGADEARSCNDVCRASGKTCLDAYILIRHASIVEGDVEVDTYIPYACSDEVGNALRCRCY